TRKRGRQSPGAWGPGPCEALLLLLRAVTATCLLAVLHTLSVQRATNDLVPNTGQILHPPPADQHHRVLLQVVPNTGDVRGDLNPGRQPDTSDLPQRRVRLLRGRRVHAGATPPPLRRTLERRRLSLAHLVLAALADQLLNCGHRVVSLFFHVEWLMTLRNSVGSAWQHRRHYTFGHAQSVGQARTQGSRLSVAHAAVKN